MPQKKILIFSSTAGGAHTTASHALTDLLKNDYQVEVINVLNTIVAPFDVVWHSTFKQLSAEQLYNKLLRGDWTRSINFTFKRVMPWLVLGMRKKFQIRLMEFLQKEQPDLVLSVIPFINLPASDAAHALAIPYLLMVLDGDLTLYVHKFHKLSHGDFHMTIMKDNPVLDHQVERFGLRPKVTIHPVGVPLRQQFFEPKDRQALRLKYQIPVHKFAIMLMMGAVGASITDRYARNIATMNQDIHLIACVGRNAALGKMLEGLRRSSRVSLTVQGFTQDIAEIMAISDLLITKPGPVSIQEAIKMELPMLIHNTSPTLFWEQAHIAMVEHYGIGKTVDKYTHLPRLIEAYMHNPQLYQGQKTMLRALSSRICVDELKKVIDHMFTHTPQRG